MFTRRTHTSISTCPVRSKGLTPPPRESSPLRLRRWVAVTLPLLLSTCAPAVHGEEGVPTVQTNPDWEVVAASLFIALCLAALALRRWFLRKRSVLARVPRLQVGARWQRIARRVGQLPGWSLGACLAAVWAVLWAFLYHRVNPEWIASGVDWHDSYLCAYAFLFNDPPFYSFWRYPLYPGLAATLTSLSGMDLSISLQLISRVAMTGAAVPLYLVGRHLYGRLPAVLGVMLLLSLATYHHNAGTVTAYPMFTFAGAMAVAGAVAAVQGKVLPLAVSAIGTAMLFVLEPKGLAPGLTMLAIDLAIALLAPGAPLRRLGRLLLVPVPVVAAYLWMHALPVRPVSLEEQASSVLLYRPEGGGPQQWEGPSYVFGKFDDWLTIPRTLYTIRTATSRPEFQAERRRRRTNSINRFKSDYAGVSWRVPLLCALGLVLPLFRPGLPWRSRIVLGAQLACVAAYVGSAIPLAELDYQERYVVHAVVFLPLLAVGALAEVARFIFSGAAWDRWLRGAVLLGVVAFVMTWPGSAFRIGHPTNQFDPRRGGRQERDIYEWAKQTMRPGDILFDTTWMMTATLLAGQYPVARPPDSYPPGGAPNPSSHWRVTRPWPARADGVRYALVGLIPDQHLQLQGGGARGRLPPDQIPRSPENRLGARLMASSRWTRVFQTEDGFAVVLKDTGERPPPWWDIPPRLQPDH